MKKLLATILILSLVLTMAVGCSPSDEAEETKSLKVTSGLWSRPEEQQFIREEILPGFEEEFNVKVELEVIDNIEKVMEAQKASDEWTTDVVMTHSGTMPLYIANEYVQPLDSVKDSLDITFMDAFESATTQDGKTYYLPISADVYLLIANQKALPYLPDGADVTKLTWEEYKDWAINIADAEGAKVSFPLMPIKASQYQVGGIGLSYGSEFPMINSPGMLSAWELLGEMVKNNAILETSFNYDNPVEQMKSEEAWLTFYHMVPVGDIYSSAPAKYVVAAAPAGPNGNGSIAGAWGVGITAGTNNKDVAEDFIKYLARPEVLYEVAAGTGGFIPPVNEVIAQLGEEPKDIIMKKGLDTLENGVVSGVPASEYTDWGAVKSVFDTVFQEMWDNDGELAKAFLDEQQKELEKLEK
jgi:multiple sugar transport system substrate-binding protein